MPDPETPSPIPAINAAANLAFAVATAIAPGEVALLAAMRAVLREAPALFTSFVALFTDAPMTPAAKAAWDSQIADLMNPEKMLEESRKRVGGIG